MFLTKCSIIQYEKFVTDSRWLQLVMHGYCTLVLTIYRWWLCHPPRCERVSAEFVFTVRPQPTDHITISNLWIRTPILGWLRICFVVCFACACIVSTLVRIILFVYQCEVCEHIELRGWILRYCMFVERMLFTYCFVVAFFYFVPEWSPALWSDTNGWYRMTRDSVNHGRPTVLMGKIYTRYCGLVLGSHVEK
jgi:uncharacterized BrkB/YihY/UPF0761 family membrane protein